MSEIIATKVTIRKHHKTAIADDQEASVADVARFMGVEINHNGEQVPDDVIAGYMVEKAISGLEAINLETNAKNTFPITEATTVVKVLTDNHIDISSDKKYRLASGLYVASQVLRNGLESSEKEQVVAAREVLAIKCDQSLGALQKTTIYNVLAP